VVAEGELGVVGPDPLDPVAADEDDLVKAGLAQRRQRPVEDAPPADLGVALRRPLGQRHQPAPPAGPDDDRLQARLPGPTGPGTSSQIGLVQARLPPWSRTVTRK